MSMKPASKLPWRIDKAGEVLEPGDVLDADGYLVLAESAAFCRDGVDMAYIVHAANNYPQLVEALKELHAAADIVNALQHGGVTPLPSDWSNLYDAQNKARAALAAA